MVIDIVETKPKLKRKTFTIREVYESFVKNGMEHVRGQWYSGAYDEKTETWVESGGCLLGQGAMNLHTYADNTHAAEQVGIEGALNNLRSDYTTFHKRVEDKNRFNLLTQLDRYHLPKNDPRVIQFGGGTGLGDLLISGNDAYDYTPNASGYILKTWEDVLAFAKEVMEPFFDKKVTLLVYA